MMRARPHAGAGRPAAARAGADRRGAAPRLRDHQAGRGKDRGLVLAEPRHRLSDADLSGRSRLRHGFDRRRKEALHHHRRRPRLSRRQSRPRQRRARPARRRSANASAAGGARRAANATAAATCRRWSKPPSIICARRSPSGSRTMPTRNRGWSKSSPAPRRNCSSGANATVQRGFAQRPACARARAGCRRRAAAPECGAGIGNIAEQLEQQRRLRPLLACSTRLMIRFWMVSCSHCVKRTGNVRRSWMACRSSSVTRAGLRAARPAGWRRRPHPAPRY